MAARLMKQAEILSADFQKLYLAKLPALYSLLYRQYRQEAEAHDCAETALLLALGILLAQASGELREGEMAGQIDLRGRLCFRLSELLAVLRLRLPEEVDLSRLAKLGNSGTLRLPGFCAIDRLTAEAYFVYWQSEELGFALARMARLQQSLWQFVRERSKPAVGLAQKLLEQPKILLETLSQMGGSRLPQSRELLQSCLEKLCRRRLLLISGGPGSGKTTLLSSLLQILQQAEKDTMVQYRLELALCAPTARAAQRMSQGMRQGLHNHSAAEEALEALTLHKLLGLGWSAAQLYRPATLGSQNYRSPKGVQLLRLDLLVLDEASMLDSEMAYRLFSRLHPQTHVILIGDPEQLPPVGFGAFWKDLLASLALPNSELADCVVELRTSHRSVAEIQQTSPECAGRAEAGRAEAGQRSKGKQRSHLLAALGTAS